MKPVVLFVFITLAFGSSSFAQTTHRDSMRISKIARWDAHFFRAGKSLTRDVKKNRISSSSDYFKPTSVYTSNDSLLHDSLYVSEFKQHAYKNVHAKLGTGGILAIIGGGVVLIIALLGFAYSFYQWN